MIVPAEVLREISRIATKCAMDGRPAAVEWVPPTSGSDSYMGTFYIFPYPDYSATQSPPWGY